MKKQVYIVTGAAGLLGMNVCLQLKETGAEVYALVLPNDPAQKYIPCDIHIVEGDITDPESLERLFCAPEEGTNVVVIHCASIVAISPEPSQKVYDVNVQGTQNIIDKCLLHHTKKLIYVSSTGAIPEPDGTDKIVEPEQFDIDQVVGYYNKTKAMASELVLRAVREHGLCASIVYPSGICGPNDYAFGPMVQNILQYCDRKMPVVAEGSFNSVDARDLALGIIACVEKGESGEGYILCNADVTLEQLFSAVKAAYPKAPDFQVLPIPELRRRLADRLQGSSDMKQQLSKFDFSMHNLERNNRFSSEKAAYKLGYAPRPFEETIRDEVRWLMQIGKII